MSQVAFELNKAGVRTKKEKQRNARAMKGIDFVCQYTSRYSVAGFNDYVKEY